MTDREIVTLREYVEARLEATDKALSLARGELERRLEGMNEFREQLRVQAGQFLTRSEYDAKHLVLDSRLDAEAKALAVRLEVAETVLDEKIRRCEKASQECVDNLKDVFATKIEAATKGKVSWGLAAAITVLSSLALSLIVWAVTHGV